MYLNIGWVLDYYFINYLDLFVDYLDIIFKKLTDYSDEFRPPVRNIPIDIESQLYYNNDDDYLYYK